MNIEQKITSMEVAEMVGKEHKELLRDIRRYIEQLEEANESLGERKIALSDFFTESSYISEQNKELPCYSVTKKGCEFIAHKLTGVKGTEFTAKYINRFHEMEDTIVGQENLLDGISPELRAVIVVDKRVTAVENKVSHLENTMNIDYSQQRKLKSLAKEVVVNALGGLDSKAYKHRTENGERISAKCFSRFWHDFNDYFDINAYANLPRVRFDEAVEYINKWQLPINMQLEIEKINSSD